MLTILIFLPVLVILILVHEIGHAVVARLAGCRIEEFGIGFPPRIASKKVGETVFSLNLVPLGGFVRITGEDDVASSVPEETAQIAARKSGTSSDQRSFARKSRLARIAILLAGVAMNLILAVVFFSIVAGVGATVPLHGVPRDIPLSDARVEIVEVSDNPILQEAGMLPGDVLLRVDDKAVETAAGAAAAIRDFSGSKLSLLLLRDGVQYSSELDFPTPHVAGEPIGLALLDAATYRVPWWQAPMEGIRATGHTAKLTAIGISSFFRSAFQERHIPDDVAGPVGIAAIVGMVGRQGILPLTELTAVLSVNLALINALPIPALDGGRVLFILLETLGIRFFRGRPERLAHTIGFALLLALIMLITIGDIRRFFVS